MRRALVGIATVATSVMVVTGCTFTAPQPKPDTSPACTSLTKAGDRPELRGGYTGSCVESLEKILVDLGYLYEDHEIDGNFDAEVKAAVVEFQLDNYPLAMDGIVGRETWPVLLNKYEILQHTPVTVPSPDMTEFPPLEIPDDATDEPTEEPEMPSDKPSEDVSDEPTESPTVAPSPEPTPVPTVAPSPTPSPTAKPTPKPSPTSEPTQTAADYDYRFGPNTTKHVMLTFDDCSYSLAKSNAVIKKAQDLGISLVFAVQGDCVAEGYFDVDAARDAGHFVINHSYSHPRFLSMSYDQIMAELNHGEFTTNYARTPYGQGSFGEAGREKILKALKDSDMRLWTWTIDSNDWGEPAPNPSGPKTLDEIIARVKRDLPSPYATAAHRGDTILLHMNHKSFTPDGIKRLVDVVESKGLTVCPNNGPTPVRPTEQDFCR